jgi:hypothetical protein
MKTNPPNDPPMLTTEMVGTFTEIAAKLPRVNGRRVHTSTLWRWAVKGMNGCHLETRKFGRRFLTSIEAVDRFTAELAQAGVRQRAPRIDTPTSFRKRSAKQRQADIDTAKAELAEAGK